MYVCMHVCTICTYVFVCMMCVCVYVCMLYECNFELSQVAQIAAQFD